VLVCEIGDVGLATHAWHVALHVGLAALVSSVGSGFLAAGLVIHVRRRH